MTVCIVVSREKMYMGKLDLDKSNDSEGAVIEDALEVREMLIPTEQGQIQRMVNFTTCSPFDKSTHTVIVKEITAIIKVEETSESMKAYENFKGQFNLVQRVPAGALGSLGNVATPDFGGKFRP
jgi:hypothetical protein